MENEAKVGRNCFYSIVSMTILATDRDEGQNWIESRCQSYFTSEKLGAWHSFLEESR